ncbi:MAG: type II secretion system F family protein [Bacillota bacterium]
MLWLVDLLLFSSTVLLIVSITRLLLDRKEVVRARLARIREMDLEADDKEDELQQPFPVRVIKPGLAALSGAFGKLTPGEIRQKITQKLVHAGNPFNLDANNFIVLQLFTGLLFVGGGAVAVKLAGVGGIRGVLLTGILGYGGALIPSFMLNGAVAKRQARIQKTLPDVLDLLLVSVEAGLSFDMALKRVSDQMTGILSDEIARLLEEIRLGKVREEALRSLVKRTGVPDLNSFVSAIIQSKHLGTNLAGTLRVQAGSIRLKRKQKVEETAMKAPIKMVFPMVFLIFPALFVVLLGPAVIKILEVFRTMF